MQIAANPPKVAQRDDGTQATDEQLVRVYVWQLPVRLAHWTIFLSIIVLSFTGWYMHGPFIAVTADRQEFVMATMRYIHEIAAFAFTAALLVRLYWFLVGNRWSNWRAFLPLKPRHWGKVFGMLRYYLFLRWRAPHEVGHNRLAATTYLAVYALLFLQALTGFVLYGWIGTQPWATLFGWVPRLLEIQYVREIHYLLMFLFFAFTIHHVYSALLVSTEEKNGLMGSIFSGHKFVPRHELLEAEAEHAAERRPRTPKRVARRCPVARQ